MRKITKGDYLKNTKNNTLIEFVDSNGNLANSKLKPMDDADVTSDITTNDKVNMTRQRKQINGIGGYHSLSFGMVHEDIQIDTLPSALMSNINELIDALKDNNINSEQYTQIANYIHQQLTNG